MTNEEFDIWLKTHRNELAALNNRIQEWWKKASADSDLQKENWPEYAAESGGAHMFQDAENAMRALAEVYLNSSRERQVRLRAALEGLNAFLGLALEMPGTMARDIHAPGDTGVLRLALAVAAVHGGRVDVKALMGGLDYLYLTAQKADINPKECFQEASKIASSDQIGAPYLFSMRELLKNYYKRFEGKV